MSWLMEQWPFLENEFKITRNCWRRLLGFREQNDFKITRNCWRRDLGFRGQNDVILNVVILFKFHLGYGYNTCG